jgi:hypothetical protein
MWPIPNGFQNTVISLYISNAVDKKEISRTVTNTGIYSACDRDGTAYPVLYVSENSTVNINEL